MERIETVNKMKFEKGDHFAFEEMDYSWLLQKLAGTFDSAY